jgi:iron complex transport system ATP-binding protein
MNLKAHRLEVGHGPHSLFSCPPEMAWQAGGLHVVLGGNGSGKSTLLRTLLGLHPALDGEVFLKDAQGGALFPSDANWVRKMSYVPSKPPSQVGLKVQEVLALSGEVSRAADWHAALKPWLGQRMTELSDGQAQQVMVARAMLQTETWVMMDEPTAFLDVHAQGQLWAMLRVHLGGGGGVFLATHDLWGVERVMARLSKEELQRSSLSWIDGQELKPLDLTSSKDVLADLLSQG